MTIPVVSNDDQEEFILFPNLLSPTGLLSRENSDTLPLPLSRENSDKREKSIGFGAFERNDSLGLGFLPLSRENSLPLPLLSRESSGAGLSGALLREKSVDVEFVFNPEQVSNLLAGFSTPTNRCHSPMQTDEQCLPKLTWPCEATSAHPTSLPPLATAVSLPTVAPLQAVGPAVVSSPHTTTSVEQHHYRPAPPAQLAIPTSHRSPSAAGEPSPCPRQAPGRSGSKRGVHVRGRPEMQQTARDGATHWATKAREVRDEWQAGATSNVLFRNTYSAQSEACQGRVKCKQECLLRFLHMAAADGLVVAEPFGKPEEGFFGWMGFTVVREAMTQFRERLDNLFPPNFREDTVKESFRRAGLLPHKWQWELAWEGAVAFRFRPK
mmetsp:Transcript_33301/g.88425  ORF Transcript_33301/g.88425 Transcript_33301/m.88425 type:complete len:381 (-) Transcript_33301:85-1227(-)